MANQVAQKIIEQVIAREGDYSDRAEDSGGKTKYGVTEKLARKHGYKGQMHEMPYGTAADILAAEFWHKNYDPIADVSRGLVAELFDTSVNMGAGHAHRFLQRALNVLNNRQNDYPDIKVDGVLGSGTLKALNSFISKRGLKGCGVLITAINCLQGARYITLAEKRDKDESHVYGWLAHRIILE